MTKPMRQWKGCGKMDDLVKRLRAIKKNYDLARVIHCDKREAADRIEALEAQVRAAVALAEKLEGWIGVAANCTIESGVCCCCGDDMKRHGNPLDCGHSPVDHGAHVAMQLIDGTTSALATYRSTKEGGA